MTTLKFAITLSLFFFFSTSGTMAQQTLKSPLHAARKAVKKNKHKKKLKTLRTDIMTDPILAIGLFPSVGIHLQTDHRMASLFGLYANSNRFEETGIADDMKYKLQTSNIGGELRLYPFRPAALKVNKKRKNKQVCGGKKKCIAPLDRGFTRFMAGLYIASGYNHQEKELELLPVDPNDEFSQSVITATNRQTTFHVGYLLRISHLTLGVRYGWVNNNMELNDTSFDPIHQTLPASMSLDNDWRSMVRLEVGINF